MQIVNSDGAVRALAWDGTSLYAGGHFTTAGGKSSYGVGRWRETVFWDGGSYSYAEGDTPGFSAFPLAAGLAFRQGRGWRVFARRCSRPQSD